MPFFYDQGEEKCNLHVCIPLQKEREKCLIIYAYIEEEKFDAYIITLL
jgi:predicted phosphoadenosine phosphosulfate sulfurtransferase